MYIRFLQKHESSTLIFNNINMIVYKVLYIPGGVVVVPLGMVDISVVNSPVDVKSN